jgi:hypothetical protein
VVNLSLAIITINGWNRLAIGFRKIPREYQPTHVVVSDPCDETTKRFTADEFRRVMRFSNLVGAVRFGRHLERLADSESRTGLHALGVLTELGRRAV